MASGDFTATEKNNMLVRIKEIFSDNNAASIDDKPIESARAVLENQTATTSDLMSQQTNECIGVEVGFLKDCSDSVVDHENSANDLESCDISGVQSESGKIILQPNAPLATSFEIDGKKCNTLNKRVEEKAFNMTQHMAKLENALSKKVIAYLNGAKETNTYTQTQGTIQGNSTYFDSNLFGPDLIAELYVTAKRNGIGSPVFLNGTNFFNSHFNAQYNELNDDQKDQAAKFAHFKKWYWDIMDLDQITGSNSTFIFDADNIVFWNPEQYSNSQPEMKSAQNGTTYVYSVPSQRLMFRKGGSLVPVRFDVEEQWVCKVRDGHTKVYDLNVRIALRYGLNKGPEDCDGNAGFLEIINGEAT